MKELYLNKIILTQYRNYQKENISFCKGLNFLTGQNGMGKTNVLDAIHYLCMCKSSLTSLDKYVVNHDSEFFRLEGVFNRGENKEKIVAKVIPRKSKIIERNDVAYTKRTEHIGFMPVVIVLPDDTDLIKDGSEERRKFMDNTLSQINPEYLKQLIVYNKLLKQRNALLKENKGRNINQQLLETYNFQMRNPAEFIHQKRKEFIIEFTPIFQKIYSSISKESEEVNLAYKSQLNENDFLKLINENLQKDVIMCRSHIGIHKDDIQFEMSEKGMKKFASQGQLKSFVLSLGLAKYEMIKKQKQIKPILLLDDIFDKLDRSRVSQLLTLLSQEKYGQIFLTDTNETRVRETIGNFQKEFCIFNVIEGKVKQVKN